MTALRDTAPPESLPESLDDARALAARVIDDDRAAGERSRIIEDLGALIADMAVQGRDRTDPMREIFARVGDRWSLLLLLLLRVGSFRHAGLRRVVSAVSHEGAISQRILTLRLRTLERDGLIRRTVTPTVPPRVDYDITPLGLDLLAQLDQLMAWVRANSLAVRESRARFDAAEQDPNVL